MVPAAGTSLARLCFKPSSSDPVHERRGFASAVMRTLVSRVPGFQVTALCPSDHRQALYPPPRGSRMAGRRLAHL
jgi:hypothetical protein